MSDRDQQDSSPKDFDARYFPRWDVGNKISYRLEGDDQYFDGKTKDISCAGACIVCNKTIAPHQKIKVNIELAKGTSVNLKAHILWVRPGNSSQEMGITFYDAPDSFKDLILEYAFELDKEKVAKQWFRDWNG